MNTYSTRWWQIYSRPIKTMFFVWKPETAQEPIFNLWYGKSKECSTNTETRQTENEIRACLSQSKL